MEVLEILGILLSQESSIHMQACPTKQRNISPRNPAEIPNLSGKRADVAARRDGSLDGETLGSTLGDADIADADGARREGEGFSLACELIRSYSIDMEGTVLGRNLRLESLQECYDLMIARDREPRSVDGDNGFPSIETRRCTVEPHGKNIGLIVSLEIGYEFGAVVCRYQKETTCQRIECSRMSHFLDPSEPSQSADDVKTRYTDRFINQIKHTMVRGLWEYPREEMLLERYLGVRCTHGFLAC